MLRQKTLQIAILALSLAAGAASVRAADQAAAKVNEVDAAAIKQAALDYIEGWYTGNAERMERAVHPELAKRIVFTDPQTRRQRLDQQGAMTLVQGTRARSDKPTPAAEQTKDVTILDVYENAASVKVVAFNWIDYLHLARWNGQWKIINVLWEFKPERQPK
jgi:hypothetical protein